MHYMIYLKHWEPTSIQTKHSFHPYNHRKREPLWRYALARITWNVENARMATGASSTYLIRSAKLTLKSISKLSSNTWKCSFTMLIIKVVVPGLHKHDNHHIITLKVFSKRREKCWMLWSTLTTLHVSTKSHNEQQIRTWMIVDLTLLDETKQDLHM